MIQRADSLYLLTTLNQIRIPFELDNKRSTHHSDLAYLRNIQVMLQAISPDDLSKPDLIASLSKMDVLRQSGIAYARYLRAYEMAHTEVSPSF